MKTFKSIRSFFHLGNLSSAPGRNYPSSEKKRENSFKGRFKLGAVLGTGNFSVVKEAIDLENGRHVAVKVIPKKSLNKNEKETIKTEVAILTSLDHPHIIKLYGLFEDKKNFYIVTELVKGGELFDRIVEREFYNEADAAKVVRLVAEALHYCNKNGVVHRDLKPENVLLTDMKDDSTIKLADFGFAKMNSTGKVDLKTICGTPGYVAPEILSGKSYGKEVDMWSLGVISYILLCGYPPFYDKNQANLFKKIKRGEYTMEDDLWSSVSEPAKNLVNGLLTVDVAKRLTVDEVINHPWVAGSGVEDADITSTLDKLRSYQALRRLKKGVHVIMAANRLRSMSSSIADVESTAKK